LEYWREENNCTYLGFLQRPKRPLENIHRIEFGDISISRPCDILARLAYGFYRRQSLIHPNV
jgi:hypothetical protein